MIHTKWCDPTPLGNLTRHFYLEFVFHARERVPIGTSTVGLTTGNFELYLFDHFTLGFGEGTKRLLNGVFILVALLFKT